MIDTTSKFTPYSEHYKETCFQAWYAANRPTRADIIMEVIPNDEYERKPVLDVIRRWRNEDFWDVRADELDAKAFAIAEDELINSKVLMLKEHAARARKVQFQAEAYLDEHGFDSSSSAAQALFRAAEEERKTRGLSAKLLELADMDDEALNSRTQKLLQRYLESGEGTIIDLAETPENDESED